MPERVAPRNFRISKALLTLFSATLSVAIFPWIVRAAGAPATPPGAGTFLQELKPVEPPAPAQPELQILQPQSVALPQSLIFTVNSIRITGNTLFSVQTLHALIAEAESKELTLAELSERAARITDYYHAHGYPLARALLPAQTIADGVVQVQVIEARYGKVTLDNHSRVGTALLQATTSPLKSGQVIEQRDLDRILLKLGDIPGLAQSATLAPGDATGTSDLLVQIASGPAAAGSLGLDNYGNRFTGRERASGELAIYDPLHHGDVLDANLVSAGKGLDSGRLFYDYLLNGEGTHLGASYSALHYILGSSLAALDGYGSAHVSSAWVKQPLLRTRDLNLYGQVQFEHKELRDNIEVSGIHTDRHLNNWSATLAGDWRDRIWSGGTNSWSVTFLHGRANFDDATAARADAQSARVQGPFSQWNLGLTRLQRLASSDSLYVSIAAQRANGNLDASQKMIAGGAYTVRSYDMSALSGDLGVQVTAEWRHDLKSAWHGQWQTIGFADEQTLTVNKRIWTRGKNDATLRGAGVALRWMGAHQWNAKISLAVRVGVAPALISDSGLIHAWAELNKGF